MEQSREGKIRPDSAIEREREGGATFHLLIGAKSPFRRSNQRTRGRDMSLQHTGEFFAAEVNLKFEQVDASSGGFDYFFIRSCAARLDCVGSSVVRSSLIFAGSSFSSSFDTSPSDRYYRMRKVHTSTHELIGVLRLNLLTRASPPPLSHTS